ncbi:MAG: FG-GAP-like repeat-containing protein [Phycisphaerales bacterium]
MERTLFVLTLAAASASAAWGQWQTSFVNETTSRLVMSPTLQNDNLEKDFAWGDFDNDGDVDLVVARKFPGSIQGGFSNILLMNEGGVLVDRTTEYGTASDVPGDLGLLAPTNDRDIKAADVNLDGWLDLVTSTTMSDNQNAVIGQPRVYINLGEDASGNWLGFRFEDARIPVLFAKNGSAANPRFCDSVLVDLTGDGYPDLYFTDYDTPETSGTVCIDLNGDGDTADPGECQQSPGETASKDYDNKFLVNWGNSGGPGPGYFFDSTNTRFTTTQLSSAFGAGTDYGDFNGDGYMDLIRISTLTAGQNASIFYAKAPPQLGLSFTGPDQVYGGAPYACQAGDLNNDGKLDLVLTDDGQDRYLLNTGNGADGLANFTTTIIGTSLNEFGNTIKIADMDNDGKLDVMIADVDGDLPPFCPSTGRRGHIYRNNGTPGTTSFLAEIGQIIPNTSLGATYDWAPIDINGDGWKDLVVGRCAGIEIWMNHPPIGIGFAYPSGHPSFVSTETSTDFNVNVSLLGGGPIISGSLKLNYRVSGGPWQSSDLVGGPTTYVATLPATACGETLDYYVSGTITSNNATYTDPAAAPSTFYTAFPSTGEVTVYATEFENGVDGWTTEAIGASVGGAWELGDPVGTNVSGVPANPENDNTPGAGVSCWVTDNGAVGGAANTNDVDNGPVNLISPAFPITVGSVVTCNYAAWVYCNDAAIPTEADFLSIEYSFDGGANWILGRRIGSTGSTWQNFTDVIGPATGSTVIVRFSGDDVQNNSTTELGVDSVLLKRSDCVVANPCPSDLNGDSTVDAADLAVLLGAWGGTGNADLDASGTVDAADLAIVLGAWGPCP